MGKVGDISCPKRGAAHTVHNIFFKTKEVQFNELVVCLLGLKYKWIQGFIFLDK